MLHNGLKIGCCEALLGGISYASPEYDRYIDVSLANMFDIDEEELILYNLEISPRILKTFAFDVAKCISGLYGINIKRITLFAIEDEWRDILKNLKFKLGKESATIDFVTNEYNSPQELQYINDYLDELYELKFQECVDDELIY